MPMTKNPPAPVKKYVVNVATVEEPSSDDESVFGEWSIPNHPGLPQTITVEQR